VSVHATIYPAFALQTLPDFSGCASLVFSVRMSEPTRAELRELVKRAQAQRERIEQLTVELVALDAQIKRADRTKKRRPSKRKTQK
jgi:hypothetical protein